MATCNPLSSNDLRMANFRLPSVYFRLKDAKLKKEFIRDGTRRIIGSAICVRDSGCLWVVGGLLFSFAAEGAVVRFGRKG